MKYVKVITCDASNLEEQANDFYKEIQKKGHKVIASKMQINYTYVIFLMVVDDAPKKKP